jgi:hypothetical protein
MAALLRVETAAMTSAELRSRMGRSGVSSKRLAQELGVARPQVAKWRTGTRPIPAHHIAATIRLTDNPPPRMEPAWRPPADMPAGRSKGWGSKVSRQRRAARAERPEPLPQQPARLPRRDRPAQAPAVKPGIDRPAPVPCRDWAVLGPRLDISALTDLLKLAGLAIGSNGAVEPPRQKPLRSPYRATSVAPVPRPVAGVASVQRLAETRQSGIPEPRGGTLGMPGMAGPLHADFVRQHNMTPQTVDPDAIMLLRFFEGGVERCGGAGWCRPAAGLGCRSAVAAADAVARADAGAGAVAGAAAAGRGVAAGAAVGLL